LLNDDTVLDPGLDGGDCSSSPRTRRSGGRGDPAVRRSPDQHTGVVIIDGDPGHPYTASADFGLPDNLRVPANYLAVTAACFDDATVGVHGGRGLSTSFPATTNDVDLCLKVRAPLPGGGTPEASCSLRVVKPGWGRFADDERAVHNRWATTCDRDPYYTALPAERELPGPVGPHTPDHRRLDDPAPGQLWWPPDPRRDRAVTGPSDGRGRSALPEHPAEPPDPLTNIRRSPRGGARRAHRGRAGLGAGTGDLQRVADGGPVRGRRGPGLVAVPAELQEGCPARWTTDSPARSRDIFPWRVNSSSSSRRRNRAASRASTSPAGTVMPAALVDQVASESPAVATTGRPAQKVVQDPGPERETRSRRGVRISLKHRTRK